MTPAHAQVVIALLVVALAALAVIGLILWRRGADNRNLDARLIALETRVQTMPTHHDLLELRNDMANVAQSIGELNGQTQTMTQMLRTIQEYLLEKER